MTSVADTSVKKSIVVNTSVERAFEVFTSGFGNLKELATGWMVIPLIVEALLGTLLWALFIVAFSRKVIR